MLFDGPVPVPASGSATDAVAPTAVPPLSPTAAVNELSAVGELDAARPETVLRLSSGQVVSLPTELLLQRAAGQQAEPWAPSAPAGAPASGSATPTGYATQANSAAQGTGMTIPLLAEQAEVSKQTVTTGTVRLHKGSETFTENVRLPITQTGWDVQRIPMGQLVPERPEVRQEGDVTVFPLVEERLVARREYLLVEEVRVRRIESTIEHTASLELRRDVLTVEREGAEGSIQP